MRSESRSSRAWYNCGYRGTYSIFISFSSLTILLISSSPLPPFYAGIVTSVNTKYECIDRNIQAFFMLRGKHLKKERRKENASMLWEESAGSNFSNRDLFFCLQNVSTYICVYVLRVVVLYYIGGSV